MAPSNTGACVSVQLKQLIHYHIDNNLTKNALFFAERLAACEPKSSESAYLLSLCHLRLGDYASAYEYSKQAQMKGSHLGCIYVHAQACMEVEKHKEGIITLERSRGLWTGKSSSGKHNDRRREPQPDGSAVNCLLGKLYRGYGDQKKAISCFEEALQQNPFMWDAFTILCDMGTRLNVANIFRISTEMEAVLKANNDTWEGNGQIKDTTLSATLDHATNRSGARSASAFDAGLNSDPFNGTSSRGLTGGLFQGFGLTPRLNESNPSVTNIPAAGGGGIGPEAMETPTGPTASVDVTVAPGRREPPVLSYSVEPPHAPPRKARTLPGLLLDFNREGYNTEGSKAVRPSSKRPPKLPLEGQAEESAATQALRNHNLITASTKRTVSGQAVLRQTSEDPGAPQRRSVRLMTQFRPSGKPSSQVPNTGPTVGANPGRELKKARPPISKIMRPNSTISTVGRQVSGNRKPVPIDSMNVDEKDHIRHPISTITQMQPQQKSSDMDSTKQEDAMRWLLDLFRRLGSGYFALSQYQCQTAVDVYRSLDKRQRDTPWVLAQLGRALYEQASYAEAEVEYRNIRIMAPTRFTDLEIYSTILWHLKRETDLSFLAHELIDTNWKSPQAWCTIGNAWSLSRDHEQALRAFKRATQLDPSFAYAFTLQGHEHVANEEFDKALVSYRRGIAADTRHYNAWYGVGRVYEKQGQYDKALASFTKAAKINPTNAVLICCIGTVLEKQKRPQDALAKFTLATEIAPRSALTRFKKARSLMALGVMESALEELMILKDLAPDEAMVHFLLGRLYKSIRRKGDAVKHFTIALNLDPKASQQIKEAIENLDDGDDEVADESSMMA
ncbi:hypothetical protein BJ878DRAFT_136488 [Calycina marina]|uniref:Uncharacterized protein n=1 Tax=Calycina marina TaxID=1763456 RepID=A0A9P7Z0H4_9HELO|nr:hypothetical protein BJ878DRAFT_136488 [Calycina marina]